MEIDELNREGWRFRVKRVRGRQYLSARKGSEEKGLGLLTQELSEYITQLNRMKGEDRIIDDQETIIYKVNLTPLPSKGIPVEAGFNKSEVDEALFDIKFERASIKAIDCEHSWNGYCHYWGFFVDSARIRRFYERFGVDNYKLPLGQAHSQFEGDKRDVIRTSEILCFDCDKYIPRMIK